tara:strand:- start:318 stop:608 length:291 start_codon:yes stop_codon:yes gene_type:complete
MPNFHNIEGKLVQFTNAEETALTAKKKEWTDGAAARAWEALRVERDNKIAESDWRANSDVAMSDAWKTYRQSLRDLPSTLNDTTVQETITWPEEPS